MEAINCVCFLQRSRLVPGLSLDITVQFRPTEWKYYYDCIRIHCKVHVHVLYLYKTCGVTALCLIHYECAVLKAVMVECFSKPCNDALLFTQDEQNLLVPIHAYPVMSTAKFPSHVRFPATPVGRTRNKTLSLECDVPIDFEFQLTAVQHHPAFVVTPMRGTCTCTCTMCV